MVRIFIVKRQVRTDEWRKRIKECQASGIPVTHWSIPMDTLDITNYLELPDAVVGLTYEENS